MSQQLGTEWYLTPAEVADLFRVNPKTVGRWAKEGRLPYVTTPGGRRLFPQTSTYEMARKLRDGH